MLKLALKFCSFVYQCEIIWRHLFYRWKMVGEGLLKLVEKNYWWWHQSTRASIILVWIAITFVHTFFVRCYYSAKTKKRQPSVAVIRCSFFSSETKKFIHCEQRMILLVLVLLLSTNRKEHDLISCRLKQENEC